MFKNKRGTFTLEYAAFLLAIISAAIVMHGYIQRAVSGSWKRYGDAIGLGLQYDPGVTYIYRNIDEDSHPWS